MTTESGGLLLVEDNEDEVFLTRRVTHPLFVTEDGQEAVDHLAGAGKFCGRDSKACKWYRREYNQFEEENPLMRRHLIRRRLRPIFASLLLLLMSCAVVPIEGSKQALTTQELGALTAAGDEENGSNPEETAPNPAFYPLANMTRPAQPTQNQPVSAPPAPISIFQQSNTIFQSR